MNGTNQYTRIVDTGLRAYTEYGSNGPEEDREVADHLYHSYPRDLYTVRSEIDDFCARFNVKPVELNEREIPHIIPVCTGSFLVIDRCEANPVLDAYPDEPIGGCASSLEDHLAFRILGLRLNPPPALNIEVKFWLNDKDLNSVREMDREVRLRTKIADSDRDFKIKFIRRLLTNGERVRVVLLISGRETKHPEKAVKLMERIIEELKETAIIVKQPALDQSPIKRDLFRKYYRLCMTLDPLK